MLPCEKVTEQSFLSQSCRQYVSIFAQANSAASVDWLYDARGLECSLDFCSECHCDHITGECWVAGVTYARMCLIELQRPRDEFTLLKLELFLPPPSALLGKASSRRRPRKDELPCAQSSSIHSQKRGRTSSSPRTHHNHVRLTHQVLS